MSYTAISDVGNTILKTLRDNFPLNVIESPELIGMASPTDKGDLKLVVYLYHIEENYDHVHSGRSRTTQNPLFLNLYYLIMASSQADIKSKALEENCILGCAINIFYENPVLTGSLLEGSLSGDSQTIGISIQNPDSHGYTSKVMESADVITKNVICYKVGPVTMGGGTDVGGSRVL